MHPLAMSFTLAALCALPLASARAQAPVPAAIAAAHAHLRLNEPAEARRWLDAVPVDDRAWEWEYLHASADMSERRVPAHDGAALALAISPDGATIATAGADSVIRLWSAPNLQPIGVLEGHRGAVRDIAFSANGALLASASADMTIGVWSIADQTRIATLTGHEQAASGVAFSPDGAHISSTGYVRDPDSGVLGDVRLWSVADQSLVREWRVGVKPVRVTKWAPDGDSFFTGDWDGDLHRIHVATGAVTKVAGLMIDDTYRAIDAVALSTSADAAYLGVKDNHAHVVDLATGDSRALPGPHADNVLAIALSPDDQWLATGSVDQTIALRDAESGETFLTLRGHTGSVLRLAFSPDGARLYSVSADGTLRSWLVAGAQRLTDALTPGAESHYAVAVSADSKTMYVTGWCALVHIIDAVTGAERSRFTAHDKSSNAVAVTTDGARILTCSNDGTVRLHDATGALLATAEGHSGQLIDVQFSPDGARALSASSDALVLRDAATLEPVTRRTDLGAGRAVFSPDGAHIAAGCADGVLRILDAKSLETLHALEGHAGTIHGVAYSADGALLATAGADQTVRLWDARAARPLRTMEGHILTAMEVAFSPDASRLASSSFDQTVRVWSVESGQQMIALRAPANNGLYDVAWSPDSAHIVAAALGAPTTRWTTLALPVRLHAPGAAGR